MANSTNIADRFIQLFVKEFGSEKAMKLSDERAMANVTQWVPVLKSMKKALHTEGLPEGRMVLIHGKESSGKTTFGLYLMKKIQESGGVVAIFDQEFAITPDWAESVGVNPDRAGRLEAEYLEELFAEMERFIVKVAKKYSGKIPIGVLVDTISATPPKEEVVIKKGRKGNQNEGYERTSMGLIARTVSKCLRRVMPLVSKHRIILVIITQEKEKIGIMFGDKDDYVARRPLNFYATYRIKLRKLGKAKNGIIVAGKIMKNKLGKPFGQYFFGIDFNKGVVPLKQLKGAKQVKEYEE